MNLARTFRELDVYRNAMAVAMRIFELSQTFEELDDACDKVIAQLIRMSNEAVRWTRERPHADTPTRRHES
jgi:hypothetical protein